MKKILTRFVFLICFAVFSVPGFAQEGDVKVTEKEKAYFESEEGDPVEIKDEESEYEIIIFDPGFNMWLRTLARPEGYYSQSFMEIRNDFYVQEWNRRFIERFRYDPQLYQLPIDYDPFVDYGYEVNYKLYNYFIYFQRKYNQRLGPFLPRI
ncbi:DUF6146 family protein [Flagellimonas allohymeniacidonis]|uniref:Uncharacterized protein n=1 Tax=Flagellimonas allohymeniacidonis TaxID=2517819 RepID=A0A4Q8QHE8_9FLAO|nr:DUF6146 family protein [Allomuricauda hymeniacidonis]TAI48708.1 hypothetical protein EW142_02595 [Allomuricauda hymeniacidonis]